MKKSKKIKKGVDLIPQKVKPSSKDETKNDDHADRKTLDFGGLPDRDLKKNLGCG